MTKVFLAVGFFVVIIGLVLVPGFYGAYLAFKASIVLGIAALIIEPSPTILGWIAIFGHSDASAKLAAWLNLPF